MSTPQQQQRVEALAQKFEDEVEQFINDGLALWVQEAYQAINEW